MKTRHVNVSYMFSLEQIGPCTLKSQITSCLSPLSHQLPNKLDDFNAHANTSVKTFVNMDMLLTLLTPLNYSHFSCSVHFTKIMNTKGDSNSFRFISLVNKRDKKGSCS